MLRFVFSPISSTRREKFLQKYLVFLIYRLSLSVTIHLFFHKCWTPKFEEKCIQQIPDFYGEIAFHINNIFPSDSLFQHYKSDVSQVNLTTPYSAIHLRRGDKIQLNESSEVSHDFVVDFLKSHNFIKPMEDLVIISDDVHFANSLASIIRRYFSIEPIVNPFSVCEGGHSQLSFAKSSLNYRVYTMRRFLIEFLVLANSNNLGVSFTSNVGKCLKLMRGSAVTMSLDSSFSII